MPSPRAGGAAACMPDGRILISGGYDERGVVEGLLKSCDAYSPWQESWQSGVASLLRARWGHSCCTLGGRIYAVGGCSVWQNANAFMETLRSCEVFEDGRWQECAPLQVPRSGSRVVALGERYLAAVGGCEDPFGRISIQSSVEIYDSEARSWSLLDTQLAIPRTCASVAAIDDSRILVAGGRSSGQRGGATVEVFTTPLAKGQQATPSSKDNDVCSEEKEEGNFCGLVDCLDGRMGCQAIVLNLPDTGAQYPMSNRRCLVAVGGERCDRSPDAELFSCALNIETGKWCESDVLPPLQGAPRTAVALCVGAGRVADPRFRR